MNVGKSSTMDRCAFRRAYAEGDGRRGRRGSGHRFWVVAAAVLAFVLVPLSALAQPGADAPTAPAEDGYEDTDPRALADFREPLEPHGRWVDHPQYGTVWVPHVVVVGKDFAPYRTAGRWAVTDDGAWVWVSDYEWGHIPFHYGRWVWIEDLGWSWIPGRRYAPAWVVWRTGEPGWDYVGWAPMGPSYIWVDGTAVSYWGVGVLPFWFVSTAWLFHPYWYHHVLYHPHHVHSVFAHTHVYHGHYHGHRRGHRSGSAHGRVPARPSAQPGDRQGARPEQGSTSRGASPAAGARAIRPQPVSPSFREARIAPSAQPTKRIKEDRRALAYAKPSAKRPKTRSTKRTLSKRSAAATRSSRRGFSRAPAYSGTRRGSAVGRSTVAPSTSRSSGTRVVRMPRSARSGGSSVRYSRSRAGTAPAGSRYSAPNRWSSRTQRSPSRAAPSSSRSRSYRPSSRAPSSRSSSRWSPSRSAVPSRSGSSSRKSTKKSSKKSSSSRKSRSRSRRSIRSRSGGRRR